MVLVGPPNTGKSALVRALTNAEPEVADHPFTTWEPTPGMLDFHHVQIQLIDLPPLNPDYIEPDMMDLIRRADLLLLVVDLQGPTLEQIEASLELPGCSADRSNLAPGLRPQRRALTKPILVVANKCDDEALDEDFAVLCELLGDAWPLIRRGGSPRPSF